MDGAAHSLSSTKRGVKRRREIASCAPCYSKKQKCNRQFPCNHCTRRRRPELCTYSSRSSPTRHDVESVLPQQQEGSSPGRSSDIPHAATTTQFAHAEDCISASGSRNITSTINLSGAFGYFEGSVSNTLAYLRQPTWQGKVESATPDHRRFSCDETRPPTKSERILFDHSSGAADLQNLLLKMPTRGVMDFLTQHFFKEVNWIHQFLYPPVYLSRYELWWNLKGDLHVEDIQFALLMLQICTYASGFLPTKEYTSDMIRGQSLSDIRSKCTNVANLLKDTCDPSLQKTTLTRVQQLCLEAMSHEQEGRTDLSRSVLSQVIQEFQAAGMHREPIDPKNCGLDELEQEMRRRIFCNLYVWDRRFFSSLDHDPLLAETPLTISFPKMHLTPPDQRNANLWIPDPFTVRVLQAQLARFWFPHTTETAGNKYDINTAEEWYERFSNEFLPQIPSPFALLPKKEWDQRVPDLSRQRNLFHISLYESICYNFRQLLRTEPDDIRNLAKYKLTLLVQHHRYLMKATVGLLESVLTLHSMLGSQQTRFPLIPFHYFEGSVYLVLCLEMEATLSKIGVVDDNQREAADQDSRHGSSRSRQFDLHGPLRENVDISETHCLHIIEKALSSLDVLALCSTAAETAASVIRSMTQKPMRERGEGGGQPSPQFTTSSVRHIPQLNACSDGSHLSEHGWKLMCLDWGAEAVPGALVVPATDLLVTEPMCVSPEHFLEFAEHPEVDGFLSSFITDELSMDDWAELEMLRDGVEED